MTAAPGPSPIGGGPAPGGARCRTPGPPESGPDEFLGGVGDFFEGAADAVGDAAGFAADKVTDVAEIGTGIAAGAGIPGADTAHSVASAIDYEPNGGDRQTARNPTGERITQPIEQGVQESERRFRESVAQERQSARNPDDGQQQGGPLSNPVVLAALVGVGGFVVVQATS